MTATKELLLPIGCQIMDAEEMTYTEGGAGVTKIVQKWYGFDLYISNELWNMMDGGFIAAGGGIGGVAAILTYLKATAIIALNPAVALGLGLLAASIAIVRGIAKTQNKGKGLIFEVNYLFGIHGIKGQ